MISKKKVIELAQERIDELDNGCYLVDVLISPTNSIVVEIDGIKNSVSVNDCISVSRNIEHNLDREENDFELKVSSPGLDQPFKVKQQYEKNIGRAVKVILNPHGSQEGILKDISEKAIVLEWEEKERLEGKKKQVLVSKTKEIKFEDIKETRIVITFK
tara:strand:- start:19 stop:495 length:477 start_codon:yes stop_codon:yes gene_type:complete